MQKLKEAIRRLIRPWGTVEPAQKTPVLPLKHAQLQDSSNYQLPRYSQTTSHYNLLDFHKAIDLAG
jgi:hypothetical protein